VDTPPRPPTLEESLASSVEAAQFWHRQRFVIHPMPSAASWSVNDVDMGALMAYAEVMRVSLLVYDSESKVLPVAAVIAFYRWAASYDLSRERVSALLLMALVSDLDEYVRLVKYDEATVTRWLTETQFTPLGRQVLSKMQREYKPKRLRRGTPPIPFPDG
jgi:hypothetical protein